MLVQGLSHHGMHIDHWCSGCVQVQCDSEVQSCVKSKSVSQPSLGGQSQTAQEQQKHFHGPWEE
jgi:hypothetical protein